MAYIHKSNPIICALRRVDVDEIDVYKPTKLKVTRWFNMLNREVFWNELPPFRKIVVKKLEGCWGECSGEYDRKDNPYCNLYLNNKFPNRTDFIQTLAHECVHHYQHVFLEDMSHGNSFFEWKKRFNQFELNLQIKGKKKFRHLFE